MLPPLFFNQLNYLNSLEVDSNYLNSQMVVLGPKNSNKSNRGRVDLNCLNYLNLQTPFENLNSLNHSNRPSPRFYSFGLFQLFEFSNGGLEAWRGLDFELFEPRNLQIIQIGPPPTVWIICIT